MGDVGQEVAKDEKKDLSVRFIVTGFGPFGNVTSNPTSVMSEKLIDYLKNHADKSVQDLAPRTSTTVLEVSAKAVKEYLNELSSEENSTSTVKVLLHLGVNYSGNGFQLEQCAYNNADFRIPDELGYQPQKECVVEGLEFNQSLNTPFDVPALCEALHKKYPGSDKPIQEGQEGPKDTDHQLLKTNNGATGEERDGKRQKLDSEATPPKEGTQLNSNPIRIFSSTDPGRYVCNYIFCYSLNKFCCNTEEKDGNKFVSLFLHVPPFDVIPEKEQIQFVVELMLLIEQQLTQGNESV